MKVVIMAGGEGTRLRPLTCTKPKPMVPIVNRPVMEHIVNLVRKHNFREIAVTLQYMPEVIKDYFDDGRRFGIEMNYFVEDTPLGTAGSVKNAEDFIDDTFVVISGDALTDIDISKAVDFHASKRAIATLVLKKVDVPLEYGVVVTNRDGRIQRFLEKPSWGEVFSDTANTGIYVLNAEVLRLFNKNERFDFSKDLFPMLLKNQLPIYGYVTEDYWCDVGDIKAYIQVHSDILDGKVKVDIAGKQIMKNVWADNEVNIGENVSIKGPCIIGKASNICNNAFIGPYSIIGEGCNIGERTSVKRSILWNNCTIGRDAQLRGGIAGEKVCMKKGASLFEQAVIGDNTVVEEAAIIKPEIKIWPNKIIESGTQVNANLVWGAKYTKSVFGHRGIAGEINVDITPEYASKLGAVYGATLKNGENRVGISTDDSNTANMLKMSFTAGMLSSGAEVFDMHRNLLPMTRWGIWFHKLNGGIHIRTSIDDGARLFIDFIDKNGATITRTEERRIENLFVREDFSRSLGESVRGLNTIQGIESFYTKTIINGIKSDKLDYYVVANSHSDFVHKILKQVLNEAGCRVKSSRFSFADSGIGGTERIPDEIDYFSNYVTTLKADIGVLIDECGERMTLIDEKGRHINRDMFTALVALIVFKSTKNATVFVPVSSSHVIEQIADANDGKVLRTKTSEQDIMAKLLENGSEAAINQFILYFDAIAGIVKILDFMKINDYKLSNLSDMIPQMHMKQRIVECPWQAKGRVIREIMQSSEANNTETTEGIKVFHEKGWVLVLPDAQKPVCKVIGEGYSEEYAEELIRQYSEKVLDIGKQH